MRKIRVNRCSDGSSIDIVNIQEKDNTGRASVDDFLLLRSVLASTSATDDPRDPNRAFTYNFPISL